MTLICTPNRQLGLCSPLCPRKAACAALSLVLSDAYTRGCSSPIRILGELEARRGVSGPRVVGRRSW